MISKIKIFSIVTVLTGWFASPLFSQKSYEGPHPSLEVIEDAAQRRSEYLDRVNEVIEWRANVVERGDSEKMDLSSVSANLLLGRNLDECSARVIEMMETPGSGPFWRLPVVAVTFTSKELLSDEAHAAIR